MGFILNRVADIIKENDLSHGKVTTIKQIVTETTELPIDKKIDLKDIKGEK